MTLLHTQFKIDYCSEILESAINSFFLINESSLQAEIQNSSRKSQSGGNPLLFLKSGSKKVFKKLKKYLVPVFLPILTISAYMTKLKSRVVQSSYMSTHLSSELTRKWLNGTQEVSKNIPNFCQFHTQQPHSKSKNETIIDSTYHQAELPIGITENELRLCCRLF